MKNSKIEEGCLAITLPNLKQKEKFKYLNAGLLVRVGKFLGTHKFMSKGELYITSQNDIWEINIPMRSVIDKETIGPNFCLASESLLQRLDDHLELKIKQQETILETE